MLTKLLIGGLILTVIGGILFGGRMLLQKKAETSAPETKNLDKLVSNINTATPSGTIDERVRQMELAMAEVVNQLKKSPSSSGGSSDLEKSVKGLETSVNELKSRVQVLESGSSTTTSSKKSPLYIPLGWTGTTVATDWSTITTQEIVIDPADYPGYTSIQFEGSIKVLNGQGRGYARVLNNNDGTSILSSEISTTDENYTWVSSSGFSLPGKKTYRLQLKSLNGYEAAIGNARIRVNF